MQLQKYRNKLNAESDMGDLYLQLSCIKRDIKQLVKNKNQFHASH